MGDYSNKNCRIRNFLKTIYFDTPEWVPCNVSLMPATWARYGERLEEIVLAHPRLFPRYSAGDYLTAKIDNPLYERGLHTDCWGTVWRNETEGLDSIPISYPLANWDDFSDYQVPDPLTDDTFGPREDWSVIKKRLDAAKARGDLAQGPNLMHGFMYMRLYYLRGFDNLMLDIALEDPRLWDLIEMVERYNRVVVRKYLELGAEYMSFGDDLGLQDRLPLRPDTWRKYIKPSYERILAPCRERDIPVYLHSDGHILEIIPDLQDVGVTVINPQIRANGLEGLQCLAKGRLAIHQDLDRQLFPFATPQEIVQHIEEVFEGLYLPEGGLMLLAECEPDVPLENIAVICDTLECLCRPPHPSELNEAQ